MHSSYDVVPILDFVRRAAEREPDRVAVSDGSLRLSRRDLYATAAGFAARLTAMVGQGEPIGLYLPNDALLPVAVLACAAAGCPQVSLDVRYPRLRNEDILRRAGITTIVEGPIFRFDSGASGLTRVALDVAARPPGNGAGDALPPAPRALALDEPFVVLYTSGSTGAPKGVVHSQRSLLHSVYPDLEKLGLSAADRMLTLWSPSTIAGIRALLSALYSDALCVIREPQAGLRHVVDALRDEGVTICRVVPALMRALVQLDDAREALAGLRMLTLGGERVYGTDVVQLRRALPRTCRISVGYGSTEAGAVAQWFVGEVTPGVVASGYAVRGATLEVLDEAGRVLPAGEVGELRCSGRATALGFWDGGRILTEGIAPVAGDPLARACRTGDLFRRRPDGLFEHVGRTDRMVKLQGRRVDLGDVEAVVRATDGVADAAVIAVTTGDVPRVVAFVVRSADAAQLSATGLRGALRTRLPEHMVPSGVRFIEAIPHLPGFKPDVAALERLAAAGSLPAREPLRAAREGTTARAVMRAWGDVLGGESVASNRRWIDAGGTSLRMLQLAYALEKQLARPVPLEAISSEMRPSDLIDRLETHRGKTITGTRTSVILLPGMRGDEPKLVEFRRRFDERTEFFVASYLPWPELVHASFDELVDDVFAAVVAGVRDGPFVLVGFSFGGLVAHELARRLCAAGKRVAFVGLLDTSLASAAGNDGAAAARTFVARLRKDIAEAGLRTALATRAGYRLAVVVDRYRPLRRAAARFRNRLPLAASVSFSFDYYMLWFVRGSLASAWRPRRLEAPVTLFRCRSHPPHVPHDLGWLESTPTLSVRRISGTHDSLLVGNDGDALAFALREAIALALEKPARERSTL